MNLLQQKVITILTVLTFCTTGFAQEKQTQAKEIYEMDAIVVTANRTKESLRNVTQNITVFTEKEIVFFR